MSHKIYLRDWYFNAGIIGFLTIATDGKDLYDIQSLTIGENYIEFEDDIFNGFNEKFTKHAFLKFFIKQVYLQKLQKAKKELMDKNTNIKPEQISKIIEQIKKPPYKCFLKSLGMPISENQSVEQLIDDLENKMNAIKDLTKKDIFEKLNKSPDGGASLQDFIRWRFKGLCSPDSISEYLEKIKVFKPVKKKENICLSCQERKAEYPLNNAISNIIGFNKDNSNWIWGFNVSKLKICPLCAIIYNCAFASFAYVTKKVDGKYLNFLYFPNENTKVKNLFETVKGFNLMLDDIEDNRNLLHEMIRQIVEHIVKKQSESITENINFIEIADNPILAGQSSKGYNIYNYNISPDIAEFLHSQFKADSIPKGYYVIKTTYYSVEEELLKLAIGRQINYSILHKYFVYSLAPDRYFPKYNLDKVTNFVIKYIQCIRGENMEKEKSQMIVKKGFKNGKDLFEKLHQMKKENQINGLVYGFLNDLKIGDRYKFLDKYTRVMIAHNLQLAFGKDEMIDDDYFLQFGYSFVNGLMSKSKEKEETINDVKKEE